MTIKMPTVEISFRNISDVSNQAHGKIVALIMDATTAGIPITNPIILKDAEEIPANISLANKKQIQNAFIGSTNKPAKLICYFKVTTETSYDAAKSALEKLQWDWLAIPGIVAGDVAGIATWIGSLRDNESYVKAVLPGASVDKEYIVNFATSEIKCGSDIFTSPQYCARIAGLLAGTPLTESASFTKVPEVDSCESLTKTQRDAAVAAGKFIIFHDGEKIKTGRGINSLISGVSDDLRKIKIIDVMDTIRAQIRKKIEDDFIGKYQNNYDNKLVLLAAMGEYFDNLASTNVIGKKYETGIDISKQIEYLKAIGQDTSVMTTQQILESDTGSDVYLYAKIKISDAVEDIYIAIQK